MAAYDVGTPRVAVYGDSITFQTAADLTAAMPARYGLRIDAVVGATSRTWIGAAFIEAATTPEPDCVVIFLGTNDANYSGINHQPPAQYEANIGQLFTTINTTPVETALVLVTLSPGPWGANDYRPDAYNAYLRQVPGCQLVDWHAQVAADPTLTTDGVHPTPAGRALLATLITDAVTAATP